MQWALYGALVLLVIGLIYGGYRLARKLGEEETRSDISEEQDKASAEWKRQLRNRPRRSGAELFRRMREALGKGRMS